MHTPPERKRSKHNPQGSRNIPFNGLRSFTRLLIGGVSVGLDELLDRLNEWEQEQHSQSTKSLNTSNRGLQTFKPDGGRADEMRLALIGWIFESQDRFRTRVRVLKRVDRLARSLLRPLMPRIPAGPISRMAGRRYQKWIVRGESEVQRWRKRGQQEHLHSRNMARSVFKDTVDDFLEYLASNPEVQELVQSQSTGLANEVIEEVRERTVSADTFLEGVARNLLRRVPRAAIPEPPTAVRMHAASLRKQQKPPDLK